MISKLSSTIIAEASTGMINLVVPSVMTGVSAFVATNLDDLLVLMIFFGQVNAQRSKKSIVTQYWPIIVGQYLGFTILLVASLPGFFGGLLVPKSWLGLLGFLPIGIGLYTLLQQYVWLQHKDEEDRLQEVNLDISAPTNRSTDRLENHHTTPRWKRSLNHFIPLLSQQVAVVTIANGGDNISIYVPLLANQHWGSLGITILVFYAMVGVWCGVAAWLTGHRIIATLIKKYGDIVVPWTLIGLGIFILIDSKIIAAIRELNYY